MRKRKSFSLRQRRSERGGNNTECTKQQTFRFFSSRHRSPGAIAGALFRILSSFRYFRSSRVPDTTAHERLQINTGRKMIKNNKKLLGVMKAEKILLYSPLLKWYLNHGLQVTKFTGITLTHPGRPFKWFPEEVSSARRAADQGQEQKQLGDTAKLKGNSFYGK